MLNWFKDVWDFYVEDINRIIFPFKVGLAVLLVSLFSLLQAPYEIFGTKIIWAILTTAIMSEYTVGMLLYMFSFRVLILTLICNNKISLFI